MPALSADPVARAAGRLSDLRRWDGEIFGCAVTLASAGRPASPFAEVVGDLRSLELQFSRFRRDSELTRFNACAGDWSDVSPRMHRLFRAGLAAAEHSDGLVNLAVLPALVAAGYSHPWPVTKEQAPVVTQPVAPLPELLTLERGRARLRRGAWIDFGAVAKGVWADEFVDHLGPNAVCSLGGDMACRGDGPADADGLGWAIDVTGGATYLVRNAGVATSGITKRRWPGGHHLIDPRTGAPSASEIAKASVLAPSAETAEWVATAVVVGGGSVASAIRAREPRCEIVTERRVGCD